VNELNPERAAALEAHGLLPDTNSDAAEHVPSSEVDAVIANPPFGAVKENGERKSWTIDGVTTNELDQAITLRALQAMRDDGSAVFILGAKGADAKTPIEKRKAYTGKNLAFFRHLYEQLQRRRPLHGRRRPVLPPGGELPRRRHHDPRPRQERPPAAVEGRGRRSRV
jgi:methylase of polypeptide subunit release factors